MSKHHPGGSYREYHQKPLDESGGKKTRTSSHWRRQPCGPCSCLRPDPHCCHPHRDPAGSCVLMVSLLLLWPCGPHQLMSMPWSNAAPYMCTDPAAST